jgi:hypothetical protein
MAYGNIKILRVLGGNEHWRLPMGTSSKPSLRSAMPIMACLCLGALLGVSWAMRLDDEQRRRIKKNLFELREMPFRIFI